MSIGRRLRRGILRGSDMNLASYAILAFWGVMGADDLPVVPVEGQPLAANVRRLAEALAYLGKELPPATTEPLMAAVRDRDFARIQTLMDQQVLLAVAINPESR